MRASSQFASPKLPIRLRYNVFKLVRMLKSPGHYPPHEGLSCSLLMMKYSPLFSSNKHRVPSIPRSKFQPNASAVNFLLVFTWSKLTKHIWSTLKENYSISLLIAFADLLFSSCCHLYYLQGMAGDRGGQGPGPGQYPYNGNTPGPDSSYGGPDSLRNTANKMFSRGQAERSDSG